MTQFLAAKRTTGLYRRHSAEWAATPLHQLVTFAGDPKPAAVTLETIQDFWAHLRRTLADTSASSYLRAVRSFFSWLVEQEVILESPMAGLKLPKVAQAARIVFCDESLRDSLIADAPNRDLKLILLLGIHQGLRKNEIVEARPEWLHLDLGVISVQKSDTFESKDRETRSIPMTRAVHAFLREVQLGSPFLLRPEVKHGRSTFRYDFRKPFARLHAFEGMLLGHTACHAPHLCGTLSLQRWQPLPALQILGRHLGGDGETLRPLDPRSRRH